MPINSDKIYFPNLNGLRFIAAFLVIIHHTEQIKKTLGFSSFWNNPFILIIGKLGVILFFVLSGFLITYLILAEQNKTGKISIKDFYIRRILRIWPLYYMIVFLAFFVLNKFSFFEVRSSITNSHRYFGVYLILYILFLPNLVLDGLGRVIPYASQAWSVGVEEQFYILWPILMKFFKNKQALMIFVILFYLFIKLLVFPLIHTIYWNKPLNVLQGMWNSFHIDCMAIGGLFALWLHQGKSIIKIFFNPYVKWINFFVLCIFISFGISIPYIKFEIYAVLFGILILNLSANPKPMFNLENKLFNFLGKISYGLYMYHLIAIVISLKLLAAVNIYNWALQLICSTLLAIIIASSSYYLIESRFIKLKVRFSKIISGDNAKSNDSDLKKN